MSHSMEIMMPARNPWPLLIIVLVAGFLALSTWSFHRANRETSAVTDSDYYSHGLRFDQTQLERTKATGLGWDTNVGLDGRWLRVTLRDSRSQPITAAHAVLTLTTAPGGEPLRLPLAEQAEGVYVSQLPSALHGEQAVRIDFERDDARLSQQLIISLP